MIWIRDRFSARGAGLGCLLVLGLIVGTPAGADDPVPDQPEPPVRLKKKVKPQPEAPKDQRPEPSQKEELKPKKMERPKPEEPKEDTEPNAEDLQEKIREITNRIAKNIGQAEERLQKKDSGEVTQQTQRDIVRDLDELIEQTRRQQQQQQQSSSSSSSSSQRNQQARKNRTQQSRASGNRPQQSQPENQSGNNPRGGKSGQEGMSKLADLYKDVWGHLPETLRQEMDQYSREQFMAKYADLLKQYYATIAEKGRRKEQP
jgi:hypothetical protein